MISQSNEPAIHAALVIYCCDYAAAIVTTISLLNFTGSALCWHGYRCRVYLCRCCTKNTIQTTQMLLLLTQTVGWLSLTCLFSTNMAIPQHNRFTALFLGPSGWAVASRELLDFMVQGKIIRGRHSDYPAGRHSIRTNQCPPPPSSHFFYKYRYTRDDIVTDISK